jgi:hypothetical protein
MRFVAFWRVFEVRGYETGREEGWEGGGDRGEDGDCGVRVV